ncbi:MAG: MBL fold metallo-hydrolase [Synechococcales bacterium]|nr:MBL fold metallo-hydrolase [Synechococcales bacterium]
MQSWQNTTTVGVDMKRRSLIRYTGAAALAALGTGLSSQFQSYQAQTGDAVTIQSLGHTCFLFSGSGRRILVNPFQPIGCTSGYRAPTVSADLVLISSLLLDEGVTTGLPGNPRVLADPGIYEFQNMQVQGIATDHDRNRGRRFGTNVVWRWNQGNLNIVHLGGAAAPITVEQQILIGRPDVLIVPVGGGVKAYNPDEAKVAINTLSPKVVIPSHYRTQAADEAACDIQALEAFLSIVDAPVRQVADSVTLSRGDLPAEGYRIDVVNYRF